jgi:DNA-binding transcriptional LysR family regulator
MPDVAIRVESALEPELMQGLVEGRIDIGVMYTPQSRPGLRVEQLLMEQLVLVSTKRGAAPRPQQGYVYIDWGPEFYARHMALFPDVTGAALTANIGWIGLQHVLENGGSGYFPRRIVAPLLKRGHLHLVTGAPDFTMPAYVAYPDESNDAAITQAVALMHRLAGLASHKAAAPRPRQRRAPNGKH